MAEEDKKDFKKNELCRICEKTFESDKLSGHFHSTGKYRGPALSFCNNIVTQKQNKFFHLYFTVSVFLIVSFCLNSWLIKRTIK